MLDAFEVVLNARANQLLVVPLFPSDESSSKAFIWLSWLHASGDESFVTEVGVYFAIPIKGWQLHFFELYFPVTDQLQRDPPCVITHVMVCMAGLRLSFLLLGVKGNTVTLVISPTVIDTLPWYKTYGTKRKRIKSRRVEGIWNWMRVGGFIFPHWWGKFRGSGRSNIEGIEKASQRHNVCVPVMPIILPAFCSLLRMLLMHSINLLPEALDKNLSFLSRRLIIDCIFSVSSLKW